VVGAADLLDHDPIGLGGSIPRETAQWQISTYAKLESTAKKTTEIHIQYV